MVIVDSTYSAWRHRLLGVLRIVTAFLFVQHGTAKWLGFPPLAYFDKLELFSLVGIAGVLEIVGGVLLLLGLFTRITAFILSGEMAVAYFIGHASRAAPLSPMINQGESAVLFCFIFLYLVAAGAGAWSIDELRQRRRLAAA